MKNLNKILFLVVVIISSCKKDFLDAKPDQALLVPTTTEDFRALLNNQTTMNQAPFFAEIACDDYYTTDAGFTSQSSLTQANYTWADDLWLGQSIPDWNRPYEQILCANVVLEGLKKIKLAGNDAEINALRGTALFFRAVAVFNLAQQFCAPYDSKIASESPGLPYPRSADVNERPGRGTVKGMYDLLIADLTEATELLPLTVAYKNLPNKQAAYGTLARVNLAIENYSQAKFYSDQFLKLPHKLIDYNSVNGTPTRPFVPATFNGNEEMVFYSGHASNLYLSINSAVTLVDSLLYRSYTTNDLRRTLFFNDRGRGVITYRGSYSTANFNGIATDEIYLIRSECSARGGDLPAALNDLNTLLVNRIKNGTHTPVQSNDQEFVLRTILQERRKELFSRGVRWSDLRRLNKDTRFAITLKRVIGGKTYELKPNDKRYVFTIPDNEIAASGIAQNPR